MAKYLVNGRTFNSNSQYCIQLCEYKKERDNLPGVFEIHKLHVVTAPERRFYLEILDADECMPIWAYELTTEDAQELCEKHNTINGFAPWRYQELTGFNV